MNTTYITHRNALTGTVTHTETVHINPPATWRDWTGAIGAGLATGAAGVAIFLLLVGIWG